MDQVDMCETTHVYCCVSCYAEWLLNERCCLNMLPELSMHADSVATADVAMGITQIMK
jgi:hypothetical protein